MELAQYAGIEALASDFDHIIAMAKGFEDLHEEIPGTSEASTGEAAYVKGVLHLHEIDLEQTAGTEGFLNAVKRGAGKIKEWILALIRAIRNWLKGDQDKKYEEAKKELKEEENKTDNGDKLVASAMDILSSPAVARPLQRVEKEVKDDIISSIKEHTAELREEGKFSIKDGNKESFHNTEINKVAELIARLLKSVLVNATEIARIDPTGETRDLLGLGKWNFKDGSTANKIFLFERDVQENFFKRIDIVIRDTEYKEEDLQTAVKNLEKLNSDSSIPDNKLSRAAAVVKEMTAIVSKQKDMIISINSRAATGYKNAGTGLVKTALLKVIKQTDEHTAKYIQDAINSL